MSECPKARAGVITKNSSTKPHAPENASYQVTFGFWFGARLVDRVAQVFRLIREGIK